MRWMLSAISVENVLRNASGWIDRLVGKLEALERLFLSRRRVTDSYDPSDTLRVASTMGEAASWLVFLGDDFDSYAEFLSSARPELGGRIDALRDAIAELGKFCREAAESVDEILEIGLKVAAKSDRRSVEVTRKLYESYQRLREALKRLGRDCGYVLRSKKPGDRIDIALLANDVANCIHVVGEEMAKLRNELEKGMERSGLCYVARDADPWLADLCKRWSGYVERNGDLYMPEDREALVGVVMDGRASFRVGSSTGHATHVYVEDGGVRVRYYDEDQPVNEIFDEVLSRYCNCRSLSDGVECWCPKTEEVKDALARMLSLVTSMDIRIREKGFGKELEFAKRFVWGGGA